MIDRNSMGGMRPRPEALYYHIAKKSLEKARELSDKNEEEYFEKIQAITTTMVFSALCLEAFINQEYEDHPEIDKVLEGSDRVPNETKWILLPLLMGSEKTFNKGAPPFQIFQELISTRNRRLVHFKPAKEVHYSERSGKLPYFSDLVSSVSTAEKYMGCIEKMIKELSRLTCGKTSSPSFLSGVKYTSEVWKRSEIQYESR